MSDSATGYNQVSNVEDQSQALTLVVATSLTEAHHIVAPSPSLSPRNMNTTLVVWSPVPQVHHHTTFPSWLYHNDLFWYMYEMWCYQQSIQACLRVARMMRDMEDYFERITKSLDRITNSLDRITNSLDRIYKSQERTSALLVENHNSISDMKTILELMLAALQTEDQSSSALSPIHRQQPIADSFTDLSLDEPSTATIVELPSSPQIPHVQDATMSSNAVPGIELPSYSLYHYDEYDVPELV